MAMRMRNGKIWIVANNMDDQSNNICCYFSTVSGILFVCRSCPYTLPSYTMVVITMTILHYYCL